MVLQLEAVGIRLEQVQIIDRFAKHKSRFTLRPNILTLCDCPMISWLALAHWGSLASPQMAATSNHPSSRPPLIRTRPHRYLAPSNQIGLRRANVRTRRINRFGSSRKLARAGKMCSGCVMVSGELLAVAAGSLTRLACFKCAIEKCLIRANLATR